MTIAGNVTKAAKPSIMVIGSMNMDLVTYTPRLPTGGETMTASAFRTGLGGKGANQAVACAKMSRRKPTRGGNDGANSADAKITIDMVGAVGEDVYGQLMTNGLRDFGVDVSGVVVREGLKTGVAVILVEETTGENRILLSAEANASLRPEAFAHDLASLTRTAVLPDLIILQLEIPIETVLQILTTAHRQNVPVLLNPAPAQTIPHDYYRLITHLVVNETEAAFLSGCTVAELDCGTSGLQRVAGYFKSLGVANVFITLGGRGVYYATSGLQSRSGLVAAESATVLDTTAAGDTFIGAYALSLVQDGRSGHLDVADAMRQANQAAAVTVGRRGAQESIPWLDELPA